MRDIITIIVAIIIPSVACLTFGVTSMVSEKKLEECQRATTTTKKLNHKTSTNCNRVETRLVPKPNGGFIPYLVTVRDPNCKEN